MKKFIVFCMTIAMALSLNACGLKNRKPEQKENIPAVTHQTENSVTETGAPATETTEVTVPEDTAEPETTAAEETEATADNDLVDGMHPEFREAMDSYEAFIDEYIEFMTKYAESDDQTSMLVDYGKFMLQYTEAAEKFDAWDEDDMNDTELNYYLEVQLRVNQKLIDAAGDIPD